MAVTEKSATAPTQQHRPGVPRQNLQRAFIVAVHSGRKFVAAWAATTKSRTAYEECNEFGRDHDLITPQPVPVEQETQWHHRGLRSERRNHPSRASLPAILGRRAPVFTKSEEEPFSAPDDIKQVVDNPHGAAPVRHTGALRARGMILLEESDVQYCDACLTGGQSRAVRGHGDAERRSADSAQAGVPGGIGSSSCYGTTMLQRPSMRRWTTPAAAPRPVPCSSP